MNTDGFLKFAAVILATISAYTTAEGFKLIWRPDSFIDIVIAWGFAIAVSFSLIYFSLNAQKYIKEGRAVLLLTMFSIFAFVSSFFNFNSIFGKFTGDEYKKGDVSKLKNELVDIRIKAIDHIDSSYNYTKTCKTLDSLLLERKREENDKFRTGQGWRWREIDKKIPSAKSDSIRAAKKYFPKTNQIEVFYQASNNLLFNLNPDSLVPTLKTVIDNYNQIGTIANSTGKKFNFSPMSYENNSGEPDFALRKLKSYFSDGSKLSEKERSSIALSLFIAFLLDFPIFVTIVLFSWKKRRKKSGGNGLFGDDNPSKSDDKKNPNKKRFNWNE